MRAGVAEQFLIHLRERDGELDHQARTLSRREAELKRRERSGVRSRMRIDAELFRSAYGKRRMDPRTDERLAWLMLLAKLERGEKLVAERRLQAPLGERVEGYLNVEALYHVRMIGEVLRCFGIEAPIGAPPAFERGMLRLCELLSPGWAEPILFTHQALTLTVMTLQRKRAHRLFADSPMLIDRLEILLADLVVDGAAQVAYRHAQLDRAGLERAQRLLPWMLRGMVFELPQVGALYGVDKVQARARALDLRALRQLQPAGFASERSAA